MHTLTILRTLTQFAYLKLTSRKYITSPEVQRVLQPFLYPDFEGLCLVHKLVLGVVHLDLERYLDYHPHLVNAKDDCGCTPLWWASALGQIRNVKLLLRRGADVRLYNAARDDPLRACLKYTPHGKPAEPEIITMLLDAGPNLTIPHFGIRSTLHLASRIRDNRARTYLLRRYLASGGDARAKSGLGQQPIHCFALNIDLTEEEIELLQEAGSDVNAKNRTESTPLQLATMNSSPAVLSRLLKYHGDYSCVDKDGQNLLHWAARYGSTGVLQVLRAYQLHLSDIDTPNNRGETASELFERRMMNNYDERLAEAFRTLLQGSHLPETERSPEEFQNDIEHAEDHFHVYDEAPHH